MTTSFDDALTAFYSYRWAARNAFARLTIEFLAHYRERPETRRASAVTNLQHLLGTGCEHVPELAELVASIATEQAPELFEPDPEDPDAPFVQLAAQDSA